jgi:hypothetical protein
MRKMIALIFLMCSAVAAQGKPPVIIGHIPMSENGKLILSGQPCARKPESYFAYLRNEGGKVMMTACWNLVGDEILVNYDDGDNYSYSVAGVQFTTEFDEWLKRDNRTKRTADGEQTL